MIDSAVDQLKGKDKKNFKICIVKIKIYLNVNMMLMIMIENVRGEKVFQGFKNSTKNITKLS